MNFLEDAGPLREEEMELAHGAISPREERFERMRKVAGAILAPVAFALLYLLTGGLTPEGRLLSAVLGAVVVLWASEAIPLPVTALLGAVLCIVLGVAPARQVLAYFADPIVFLFIGSFMLARAMMVHRLDRRIALTFLSIPWLSASPSRLLVGVGTVTAVLSMWVSNTATTAMMLPIALGLLGAMRESSGASGGGASGSNGAPSASRAGAAGGSAGGPGAGSSATPRDLRDWPYATGLMLMVAYAASVGGIGTPVGSPPNLIGIGLIRSGAGVEISFLTWMVIALPMLLLMGGALFLLLYRLHPAGPTASSPDMSGYITRERATLGPLRRGELNTMLAFAFAVILWTLPGTLALVGLADTPVARWMAARFPEAVVALSAAILLFLLPVKSRPWTPTLRWSDAVGIDWGTILLFGGGLALGSLMFETGVAVAMGEALTAGLGASSLWVLTFLAIVFAVILSETTSNTAAANMVIPVVIAVAVAAGVNPVPPALGACFGASFGFMLPVSTPPNAIVYGSGLVPIPKMMRAGIYFDLLGIGIIWVGLRLLCPLLGLS